MYSADRDLEEFMDYMDKYQTDFLEGSIHHMKWELSEFIKEGDVKKAANVRRAIKRVRKLLDTWLEEQQRLMKKAQGILTFWESNCGRMYECRRDCQPGRITA